MVKQTTKFDVSLGKLISNIRIAKGLSRKNLAENLGITHQQLHKYEIGRNRISVARLVDIAKILQISPSYFIKEDLSENNVEFSDEEIVENFKIIREILTRLKLIKDKSKLEALNNILKTMI